MAEQDCPLCGNKCEFSTDLSKVEYTIHCKNCYPFQTANSLECTDRKEMRKRYNMVYEFLSKTMYEKTNKGDLYKFYYKSLDKHMDYDPMLINVAELMKNYPKNIGEKLNRIVLNISRKFPNIGEKIVFGNLHKSLMFTEAEYVKTDEHQKISNISKNDDEKSALISYLKASGLISFFHEPTDTGQGYKLTAKAWELVAELTKKQKEINQGFMAMEFSNETETISNSFKIAIDACGYTSKRIDEKEHNNQIVPEILYEIKQSKFIVVDVTCPNYGAYYEAGYAEALGKQVIICCRKNEFDDIKKKPHFDISQKSMIVWENEEELVEKLKKRIQATVGLENEAKI
jgi:nucleoside 2-deoxyribosyltransferase